MSTKGSLAFRNLSCTLRVPLSTPRRRVGTSGLPRVFSASQPLTDIITSTTNSYVKHCCKLRSSRAYREESASVLVVGDTPIQEIASHTTIKTLFLAPDVDQLSGITASCTLRVSEPVLKKLSCLETVSGLKAVAEVDTPPTADFIQDYQPGQIQRLLALERVQDPGNLGSLLRTAAGLGWDGVFLLPGCCDPFNDKALRASRGAAFKLPIGVGDWQGIDRIADYHNLTCFGAEPHESAADEDLPKESNNSGSNMEVVSVPRGLCVVLGNEGQGLSEEALSRCRPLTIPMAGRMESLNVSHAGAILMFALSEGSAGVMESLKHQTQG